MVYIKALIAVVFLTGVSHFVAVEFQLNQVLTEAGMLGGFIMVLLRYERRLSRTETSIDLLRYDVKLILEKMMGGKR